jgi:hypothetical protein
VNENGNGHRRLRLVAVTIVPEIVADDGDQLVPLSTLIPEAGGATRIPGYEWPAIVDRLRFDMDQLEMQLNGEEAD